MDNNLFYNIVIGIVSAILGASSTWAITVHVFHKKQFFIHKKTTANKKRKTSFFITKLFAFGKGNIQSVTTSEKDENEKNENEKNG